MNLIVPLAGPDMLRKDGSLKCMEIFKSEPLIYSILKSRSWWPERDKINFAFVLIDNKPSHNLWTKVIKPILPKASAIFLSDYTAGAALSCASAISVFADHTLPLVIDLSDIFYQVSDWNMVKKTIYNSGACCFVFKSDKPYYSYIKIDAKGKFIGAREKTVISNLASTGTYSFRDTSTFFEALSWYLSDGHEYTFNSLYYVCPMMNGVSIQGKNVEIVNVTGVLDVKSITPE